MFSGIYMVDECDESIPCKTGIIPKKIDEHQLENSEEKKKEIQSVCTYILQKVSLERINSPGSQIPSIVPRAIPRRQGQ